MKLKNYWRFCLSALLLIFIAFAGVVSAQQQQETKKLPAAKWARSRNIDVKHIAIDLQFDWAKKQAYGRTAITLSPLNATDKIALDAGMLTINSIVLDGNPLKFSYDGGDKNDNLKITLDRVYQAHEDITVSIDYRTNLVNEIDPNSLGGNNGKGLRFSQPTANDPIKPWEIWSCGDPEANRYWFPGYDAPNDFRTTEFTATVDKKLTVIANGKLVETKDNTDGTRAFHYKTDIPYANHLTSFIVGEFVDVKQNYDGVELHNFGYPREKESVAATVERLPDMVKFFSEMTGVKYPYPSYAQVFVQDIGTFTGNNGVSTITENMVDDFGTHADYFYLWDLTEAEALAQQWFSNHLTARDWSDVWLNKSFAHYFNALYNEHKNGRQEFLQWQHSYDQSVYLGDWSAGNRRPIVTRNYQDAAAFTTDNYATFRGSTVLHMLRKHLGEANWRKAIRHYVKSKAGKSVTTEDFQNAIEDTTGESMGWFFDQWVYKMGHPIFAVTKTYDAAKKQLTLTVQQTQKVDPKEVYPQTEFFAGKIDIEIDGRIEQVWLAAKAENIFTFQSAQEPKLVNFDFESTWIGELTFNKSFDELLYQLQHSQDILARQSAMAELTTLAKDEKTSANDRAKLHQVLRDTILGNAHWRLRMAAISQLRSLQAPAPIDEETIATLLSVSKRDKSWLKATAISALGATANPKFADLYLEALSDPSDRVISSAATALGKTKSPKAFAALTKLVNKPSMKNQSLLSALRGLKALGDPRAYDIAFQALSDLRAPRWRLPGLPSTWDFRGVAAETIASLGKSDKTYPLIFGRFNKSITENDIDGIFNNVLLITALADPRGQEAFDLLKARFKNDANAMSAVNQYETQFKAALKKP